MTSQVFQFSYVSSKGPTEFKGLKIKTHSPKGLIRLTVQGPASALDKQLEQMRKSIEQNAISQRCQDMCVNDLFKAFQAIGCRIEGSEQDKEAFLEHFSLESQVQNVTQIYHEDNGGLIMAMAYFKDSKNYYLIDIQREWPGYEY